MAEHSEHEIRAITVDGEDYRVVLRIAFDGVEYVGRLWFVDSSDELLSFIDHGAIPGSTPEAAIAKAKQLSPADLDRRCHRALSERRRFAKLRAATDEMITQIKYLNRVVINLQNGMMDRDGGQKEIEIIQTKILKIVRSFPIHAGVESD